MSDELPQFTIVGAGLAGTLLACYLGKAGYRVDVYEKRPDPRTTEPPPGRSINLALSLRGTHALREVGLAEQVLQTAIPLRGRMMHARDGSLTFQPYGKDDSESINSISRAGLNLLLVNAAASYPSVRLFFRQRCTGIDLNTAAINVIDDQTQKQSHIPCNVVIGADGAYSAVRYKMQFLERFNYQQDYLNYGYKELTIPPSPLPSPPAAGGEGKGEGGEAGKFRMEQHALHIWPRQSFMMIALPNRDGSFTCTLFWPYEGPNSFAALEAESDLRGFFHEQFPDAVPLLPTLAEDYQQNPVGPLLTIRCGPWHAGGKIVLLGDAAHAVVPFLGQGMNAAFEDCTVLAECLATHRGNSMAAFPEFTARRKLHADALADLALLNFIEMRDRVGSRGFLLRKQFENFLHRLFPRWYLPLYTMIQFTRIPYADARRRARRQDRIVGLVLGVLLAALVLGLLRLVVRYTMKGAIMDLTYATYLHLDQLLQLQQPRSQPAEHDETLFLITHQAFELWFKLQLHELEKIRDDFCKGHTYGAIATFKRVRTIMKVMVEQIDILETLTPLSFRSFRDRLETASGFQSVQFREFEFLLGYKRGDLLRFHKSGTPDHDQLVLRLQQRSVVDCFYDFLEVRGVTIPAELRARDATLPNASNETVAEGILRLYQTQPDLQILFELMTDFDEGFQEWRYRHIKLVERTIGSKHGTGGSLGVEFLKQSLFHPIFPDLWAIRHKL